MGMSFALTLVRQGLWQGALVAGLVAVVSMFGGLERARGHAGEVHTEPAPTTKPATSERSGGPAPGVSGKAAGPGAETGKADASTSAKVGEGTSVPSPPVEPDTDPTLHFVALGALLFVGAGFLLVRRRRALA